MDNMLGALYQQEMLALTLHAHFYCKKQSDLEKSKAVKNPMCGDLLIIGLLDKKIQWHGEGCLICRASIEALCQIIDDKKMDYAAIVTLCSTINHYFNGHDAMLPDKFMPLSSVKQTKSRIKCVTLATQGITEFIKGLT